MTQERNIGWNVYLYMPKLSNPHSFVDGQRATLGGMWFCKGRLGERRFDVDKDDFIETDSPIGKRLTGQVKRARSEFLRLQELYLQIGVESELRDQNSELKFSFKYNPHEKLMEISAWGFHVNKEYKGATLRSTFKNYRQDLENSLNIK